MKATHLTSTTREAWPFRSGTSESCLGVLSACQQNFLILFLDSLIENRSVKLGDWVNSSTAATP